MKERHEFEADLLKKHNLSVDQDRDASISARKWEQSERELDTFQEIVPDLNAPQGPNKEMLKAKDRGWYAALELGFYKAAAFLILLTAVIFLTLFLTGWFGDLTPIE